MSKLTKMTSTSFGRRGSAAARFTWTLKSTVTGLTSINLIRYRGGLYWAFGTASDVPFAIYTSPDLITWTFRTNLSAFYPAYSFSTFINYGLDYLPTGTAGKPLFLGCGSLGNIFQEYAGADIFGYGNPPVSFGTGFSSSLDGTRFTGSTNDGTNVITCGVRPSGGNLLPLVRYTNSDASPTISTIDDNRSATTYPAKCLNDITNGGGVVVTVGNYDFISYSANNGVSFTNVIGTFSGSDIASVAYGVGKFCAVTFDGKTATSTNGSTWTLGPTLSSNLGDKMMFAQGTFIIRNAANIFYSTDGAAWQSQAALAPSLTSTYEQGNALVVNALSDGKVYTSA
jgi:hypothetical protein